MDFDSDNKPPIRGRDVDWSGMYPKKRGSFIAVPIILIACGGIYLYSQLGRMPVQNPRKEDAGIEEVIKSIEKTEKQPSKHLIESAKKSTKPFSPEKEAAYKPISAIEPPLQSAPQQDSHDDSHGYSAVAAAEKNEPAKLEEKIAEAPKEAEKIQPIQEARMQSKPDYACPTFADMMAVEFENLLPKLNRPYEACWEKRYGKNLEEMKKAAWKNKNKTDLYSFGAQLYYRGQGGSLEAAIDSLSIWIYILENYKVAAPKNIARDSFWNMCNTLEKIGTIYRENGQMENAKTAFSKAIYSFRSYKLCYPGSAGVSQKIKDMNWQLTALEKASPEKPL